jgi:thioesterase domain-containing protein
VWLPLEQERFAAASRPADGTVRTVEAAAAAYVAAMRDHQPHGPYQLAGLCFGGLVAYEMSCQLAEDGESVNLLVMIDSVLSGAVVTTALRRRWDSFAVSVSRRQAAAATTVRARLNGTSSAPAIAEERLARHRQSIYDEAIAAYRPRPTNAPTLLVQAEKTLDRWGEHAVDRSFGWGPYVAGLERLPVPGAHPDLLRRPVVERVAAKIRPRLERARAKG